MTEQVSGDLGVSVSVVVPCGGSLDDLDELVASLADQVIDRVWEAVFVDNGLEAEERGHLERAVSTLDRARIVDEARPGISPARNAGAAAAAGELVAFIDADDIACRTWLAALCRAVGDRQIASGTLDVERLNPEWLARTRGSAAPGEVYLCEGLYPVAPGGNMAMRREDFVRLGGLDAEFPSLEDFEFSLRAWKAGYSVKPAGPDATIHYRLRRRPKVLYRQGYRYGRARAQVYRLLRDDGLTGRVSVRGWKSWLLLVLTLPLAPFSEPRRATCAWLLGNRVGRLAGSVRYQVVYL